ncbi:hypothetical protein [Saccharothrix sp. 6-C]|uniref:hypothetical protein n=1 Tax=Saccharothrix sp. 6-C TaxID=2781735 RepID=UPI001F430CDE|nr:hypothetical protein [Saccharothrix sp. 6-C]
MGINGFGRIWRDVPRAAFDRGDTGLEIVAVFGWYGNEWGYANRTLDFARSFGQSL